jgi:hypothetical protein
MRLWRDVRHITPSYTYSDHQLRLDFIGQCLVEVCMQTKNECFAEVASIAFQNGIMIDEA